MIYGLLQYYIDELATWVEAIEFHKAESRGLIRKITFIQDHQNTSAKHQKEGDGFMDQVMVQSQVFDNISHQIASQKQRLDRIASFPDVPVEMPVCNHQNGLRGRMHTSERTFIRTKYNCSIFLSAFLSEWTAFSPEARTTKPDKHVAQRVPASGLVHHLQ